MVRPGCGFEALPEQCEGTLLHVQDRPSEIKAGANCTQLLNCHVMSAISFVNSAFGWSKLNMKSN